MEPKKILVMPEYNEERTVVAVLESASRYVDLIVVVNDGSTDSSPRLIDEWMRDKPHVVMINFVANRGMSGALLAGFCEVYRMMQQGAVGDGDVVINIDADGQHRPEEIPQMIRAMDASGADVLLAKRDLSGYPRFKQIGNRGLSWFTSLLTGVRYYDVECGFRFMKARVVPELLRYFTGRRYGCAQEIGMITALLGFKINNDEPADITYYRPGARMRDGFVNVAMGLLAFARVRLHIVNDLDRLISNVLGGADVRYSPGPKAPGFAVRAPGPMAPPARTLGGW